MENRPSWSEYYKQLVEITATRSACKKLHVGCIIMVIYQEHLMNKLLETAMKSQLFMQSKMLYVIVLKEERLVMKLLHI